MVRYILKRLLQAIPLLLGIATITFFVIHLAPGDPMDFYLESKFRSGRTMDPELVELIRQKYGLDQPIHVQYVKWLGICCVGTWACRSHIADLYARSWPR